MSGSKSILEAPKQDAPIGADAITGDGSFYLMTAYGPWWPSEMEMGELDQDPPDCYYIYRTSDDRLMAQIPIESNLVTPQVAMNMLVGALYRASEYIPCDMDWVWRFPGTKCG